jgi:hypothetical protein
MVPRKVKLLLVPLQGAIHEEKKRRCFVIGPIGKEGSIERKNADMLLNAVV